MNNKQLFLYCQNKNYKLNLYKNKYINNNLFLFYLVNNNITINSNSIILEIKTKNTTKLYQLTFDVEELDNYMKYNEKYFQQIYNFVECKVILRFNLQFKLCEIVIRIYL
jgi:hypothetical protein